MKLSGYIFITANLLLYVESGESRISENSERCILPKHPKNGQWSISNHWSPDQKVPSGTILHIRCNGQYTLKGHSIIECKQSNWNHKIGQCLKLCSPISNRTSIHTICSLGTKSVDCSKPVHDTIASFSCAPYYENNEIHRNPFRKCVDGKWNQEIPSCTPVCGSTPKPNQNNRSYYPWNAAVFKTTEKNTKVFVCSGTLINERTIITSARCVSTSLDTPQLPSLYTIAVGRTVKEYEDDRDQDSQYSDVKEIFIPKAYKGSIRKYYGNMAVIITQEAFKMSNRVQPACVDWTNKYTEYFQNVSTALSIAGPLTSRFFSFVENVTKVPIYLVNDTTCYDQLTPKTINDSSFQAFYVPNEMFCSAYIDPKDVPECIVDAGVGLMTKNDYDKKFYVIGVLNSFPSIHREKCDDKRWTLYTKVSEYVPLINKATSLYSENNMTYLQNSCGIKSVKAKTLIINGQIVTTGDYPWQAAIYRINGLNKELICGGTLLNTRVILTAAHCVTNPNGNTLPTNDFVVAVGKYYRTFDDARDQEAQFSTVKNIFIPNQYQAHRQNYLGDIAIIITENTLQLTKQVQPVCVDWQNIFEEQFLQPPVNGLVTGWGYTENGTPSEVLKDLEVPYIHPDECRAQLPEDYDIFLTADKLCSGFINKSKSVCKGDSGGGLVFKNHIDNRYYIVGIVSLSPQAPSGGCDIEQYGLYTRVRPYIKDFILSKIKLHWA